MLGPRRSDSYEEAARVRSMKNATRQELERSKRFIIEQKNLMRLIYEQQKKLREVQLGQTAYRSCSSSEFVFFFSSL